MEKCTGAVKVPNLRMHYVIEKLVDEVNHHLNDNGYLDVLDDSDIDEINEAIKVLGINTSIKQV